MSCLVNVLKIAIYSHILLLLACETLEGRNHFSGSIRNPVNYIGFPMTLKIVSNHPLSLAYAGFLVHARVFERTV